MKKRWIVLVSVLVVCVLAGIAVAHFLPYFRWFYYTELARSRLLSVVEEGIDEDSDESDCITEDGYLLFRNGVTRAFLLEALARADISDMTGCAFSTWPAPTYRIGEEDIGGNCRFDITIKDRYFLFGLNEQDGIYFDTYVSAMLYARELYGIECTDAPTYLSFIPTDRERARGRSPE